MQCIATEWVSCTFPRTYTGCFFFKKVVQSHQNIKLTVYKHISSNKKFNNQYTCYIYTNPTCKPYAYIKIKWPDVETIIRHKPCTVVPNM